MQQSGRKYIPSHDDAKRVAQRLLKKYDKHGQGSISVHDISYILKDVYTNSRVTYQPNENDSQSYFKVLDKNQDQRVCLADLEQICIQYLCVDPDTYIRSAVSTYHKEPQLGNSQINNNMNGNHNHTHSHAHQNLNLNQQLLQPQLSHKTSSYNSNFSMGNSNNNIPLQQQNSYNLEEGPRKVTSILTTQEPQMLPNELGLRQVTSILTTTQQQPQMQHQYSAGLDQPPILQSNASGYRGRSTDVSGSYLKHEDSQKQRMLTSKSKKINMPKGHSILNSKNIFHQSISGMSQNRQSKMINQFRCKDAQQVGYRKGAKLQQIKARCQQTGERFTDPEFPPNNNSLSRTGVWYDGSPIYSPFWIRPEEHFTEGYYLFHDGIMPGDIQQGYLGDCYFQCSLAALAEWPERIQRIFSSPEKSDFGAYSVWIVFNGVLEEVVVDDNFWYNKYEKTFVSMQSNGEEIWPQIIEKAWAKLNKDYVSIDGGFARDALHDLTGAPVIHYRIAEQIKWNQVQELLWNQLLIGEKSNFVMCGATYGEDDDDCEMTDSENKDGIFYSHAYSILAAYEINLDGRKQKLCKLRNPHGKGEYTGRFRDGDPIWQRVSQADKQRLDYEDEDDGVFFIEYERLRTYFEDIQICQYRDHYIYEGLRVETGHGDNDHFFQIEIPQSRDGQDGYYYFQVNQKARAEFGEETNYNYTKATVNVVDQNGNWVSAAQGKQKNICSYLSQQQPSPIKAGTYYVLAKVLFDHNQAHEGIHSFGFGVYGKEQVTITPTHNVPGNIANVLRQAPPDVNEILPAFTI